MREIKIMTVLAVLTLAATVARADKIALPKEPPKSPPVALPQDPKGNLVLYVSNQSYLTPSVDITIHIDGKLAIASDFAIGNAHNFVSHTFPLAAGKHKLVVTSKKGAAQYEAEFEIKDKHWATVFYWSSKHQPKKFTFQIQDRPIGFL